MNMTLPLCDTKEQMRNAIFPLLDTILQYPQPCQGSEKIIYTYQEQMDQDLLFFDPIFYFLQTDFVEIRFKFPDKKAKLVEEKKDYDLQTLVGNAGGYVGLFLGMIKKF